jgi:hypothetical protein
MGALRSGLQDPSRYASKGRVLAREGPGTCKEEKKEKEKREHGPASVSMNQMAVL